MSAKEKETIMFDGGLWEKTTPIQHDPREGRSSTEFTFTEIHIDELEPDLNFGANIETELYQDGDVLRWKYSGKPPIVLTNDGAYRRPDDHRRSCEKQAYHAIGMLADKGYVSRWQRT